MNTILITDSILEYSGKNKYRGHDPFDSLNSSIFKDFPTLRKSKLGLAWTQFNKRFVFNLRPVFLVPEARNPKGIALFILGLINDFKRTNDQNYLDKCIELADWLLLVKCNQSDEGAVIWQHSCWGYHFDWNARAFYVPKGKPNVISTVYVSQALYALGEVVNNQEYLDVAIDSAHFIVKNLYIESEYGEYFSYIPGEVTLVHNANLWASAWLGFVASITDNTLYKNLALKAAWNSVNHQTSEGAWVYGTRPHHHFIDGFHTGYNLEALNLLRVSLATSEFDAAIASGLTYYKSELFESDGTAKYYNTSKYPLDMHSVAQAILTFLKVGGTKCDLELVSKIVQRSVELLFLPRKSRFAYQKHKYFTNKINYIRWTQAWVYYSFAYYNQRIEEINRVDGNDGKN